LQQAAEPSTDAKGKRDSNDRSTFSEGGIASPPSFLLLNFSSLKNCLWKCASTYSPGISDVDSNSTVDDVELERLVLRTISCKHTQTVYHRHESFHVSSDHVVLQTPPDKHHIDKVDPKDEFEYDFGYYTSFRTVYCTLGKDMYISHRDLLDQRYMTASFHWEFEFVGYPGF
jgi:hypothetical protein